MYDSDKSKIKIKFQRIIKQKRYIPNCCNKMITGKKEGYVRQKKEPFLYEIFKI